MRRTIRSFAILLVTLLAAPSLQAQTPPAGEASRIADGVYAFRYGNYQSMFVVAPEGVLITDPMNATAAKSYLAEIRKITAAPVRYVVYSHHHFDHIAGGAIFQEAGVQFIAQRNARPQLERLKNPAVVMPDQYVDERMALDVGGTRVELLYVGRNHTDNSLVVSVPAQKIIYAADFIPVRELIWRGIFDAYYDEWMVSLDRVLDIDWTQLIAGHPRQSGVGGKDDVRALKQYMIDLKEAVRVAAAAGKCFDTAMREIKLPQYEQWQRYREFLPLNIERLCHYWLFGWQ
jgi:glyoxylase-like metal-dependent hydrolase (beta-lactamase superfamily II)